MARLEEELRHIENEKAAVLNDLSSLRELCIKLDSGKDLMTQQLNSKSLELEKVGAERVLGTLLGGTLLASFYFTFPFQVFSVRSF